MSFLKQHVFSYTSEWYDPLPFRMHGAVSSDSFSLSWGQALLQKYQENCNNLRALQSHILDEHLIRWKRQQQLAGNGAVFEASLETLQQWCENLAELVWRNFQQIEQMSNLYSHLPIDLPAEQKDLLPLLSTTIGKLLETLITR